MTPTNRQNDHLDDCNKLVQEVFSRYKDHEDIPYISSNRDLEKWLDEVEFGSAHLVSKRNMERFEEDVLPGHLILLWRIGFGTFTNESIFPKYFEYDYGINAKEALIDIQEKGYAIELSALDSLTYLHAAKLKAILKAFDVSGYSKMKKDELIDLTREKISEANLAPLFEVRGYQLTPTGKALLEKYPNPVDRHPKKNM